MPDSARGIVAFRPAAIMRRPGGDRLAALIRDQICGFEAEFAQALHVDTKRAGFLQLAGEAIESVVVDFKVTTKKTKPQNGPGQTLQAIESGSLTVRTSAPFDWLAFFRQWKLAITELREGKQIYYKMMIPEMPAPTMEFFAYLPDDRTLVINEPEVIRQHIARAVPAEPALLRGGYWQRANRSLLAIVVDNHENRFTKAYDREVGDPEDKAVLELFAGIDRWVLTVPDAPALSFQAQASPRNLLAGLGVGRALNAVVELGRVTASKATADTVPNEATLRLYRALLANMQVGAAGGGLTVGTQHFGTLGDIADVIRAGLAAEAKAANAQGPAMLQEIDFESREKKP